MITGTPIADTKLVCTILFPQNVYLDKTYAAGAQIMINNTHEISEYSNEFMKNVDTFPPLHAFT